MTTLSELNQAKQHLAHALLNQVGVEWDEACDSVERFCARHADKRGDALIIELRCEAARYEDM